jgi:hypothetical protein
MDMMFFYFLHQIGQLHIIANIFTLNRPTTPKSFSLVTNNEMLVFKQKSAKKVKQYNEKNQLCTEHSNKGCNILKQSLILEKKWGRKSYDASDSVVHHGHIFC